MKRELSTGRAYPRRGFPVVLIVLVTLFSLSAEQVSADVLLSQTNSGTHIGTAAAAGSTRFTPRLPSSYPSGMGITSLSYLDVWTESTSDAGTGEAAILCYTNSTLTTPCPEWTQIVDQPVATLSGDTGGAAYRFDFTDETETFASNRFYVISLAIISGGAGMLKTYGISSPDLCTQSCTGTPYYVWYDSNGVPNDLQGTGIIVTQPTHRQTIATSTTAVVGATVYINDSEYEDDMFLRVKYSRYVAGQASLANLEGTMTVVEIPISEAGLLIATTTTPIIHKGEYVMVTEVRRPSLTNDVLTWFGLQNLYDAGVIHATTTEFIAVGLTAYDTLVASTTQSIEDYIASSTISIDSCVEWTSFSLLSCLNLLFIPQPQQMALAFNGIKDGFLSYVPFGYVTRTVEILTSTTTVALPDLSYTFADDLGIPILEGTVITFSPWTYFYNGDESVLSQLQSTGDNPQDFWEILSPLVYMLLYLALAFMVIRDLTHVHISHSHKENL